MRMELTLDMLLLSAAILCISLFATAVSYRFIKGSTTGEIRANVYAAAGVISLFLVAKELGKPEFENFSITMFAVMA